MPEQSPLLQRAQQLVPSLGLCRVRSGTGAGADTRTLKIAGQSYRFAQPITLTPYAAATPCTARCRFCSELFVRVGERSTSAALRPSVDYFERLDQALAQLRPLPMGLSISGLEATSDPAWLEGLLWSCTRHLEAGGRFVDKVLYTNGSGFCEPSTGNELLSALVRFGLDRIELSRHATDEQHNQSIMRFRQGQRVASNAIFWRMAKSLAQAIELRMVCVLQRGGVESWANVLDYIDRCRATGARVVVFRELARLHAGYRRGPAVKIVDDTRVAVEALIASAFDDAGLARGLQPIEVVDGYYYFGVHFVDQSGLRIIFEASDYAEMARKHDSELIHKLVFHPNGRLGSDWSPYTNIIIP